MTIDERLSKLVERHEALTQSVEVLVSAQSKTDEKLNRLVDLVSDYVVYSRRVAETLENLSGRVGKIEQRP